MTQATEVPTLAEYLAVGEAAAFLGVSPWTLRNWDKSGKLRSNRHPVSGHRMYRREDLESLLHSEYLVGRRTSSLTPHLDLEEIGESEHFVQFYESDRFLVDSVTNYAARALAAGDAVFVIATQDHRDRVARKLRRLGFDVAALRDSEQYVALDAEKALSTFMVGDHPDAAQFEASIGASIERLAGRSPRIRAFGEMVALLWQAGRRTAAIELERLWDDLAQRMSFSLFCAYPLCGFDAQSGGEFEQVCAHHSRVFPAESYSSLVTPAEQLRTIASLQQKAQQLEAEIARRKEAEREIKQADRDRAMLAAIVESSDDAIVSKTLDGIIRSWNAAAERLFGYTATEVHGKSITIIIPPERLHEEAEILARIRRGERIEHYETVRVAKDGRQIDLSLSISPIRDSEGNLIGASKIARDITAWKRAVNALREADRRKDEFLATLAHELRNPLAPIRNGLQILKMAGQGDFADEDLRDVHAMMERQLAHMVRLIDDLLDFSRISRGTIKLQKEPIALQAVIRQALETSKPLIEAGRHALDVHLPDDPVMLDADLVRLSQVFANLLNNAAKYTEPGGRISIRARCEGADAIVSVRDTGIGIPQEMLGGVFELFAQVENPLRRSQDGLGIGLSLVKSLVQLHGGSVVAHSAGLGQGSEFVVRMPLAQGDLDGSREISSATHADPALRPTTRILAVDDNKDSADSLTRMLRMLGGDVQVVYDGPSALEALTICRPAIVFMDLGMPGMDGCEVARRIREAPENRNVLLVAMTGWGKEEDRSRSRAAGFDHHLVKPVDLGGLKTLLDECAAAHVADEPPDTQRPRS